MPLAGCEVVYSGMADDMWVCSECGAENNDWVERCPICGEGWRPNRQ